MAEAGWKPVTGAQSSNPNIHIERFGDQYLTVFNNSDRPLEATLTLTADSQNEGATPDLVTGRRIDWTGRKATLALAAGDLAVLRLP